LAGVQLVFFRLRQIFRFTLQPSGGTMKFKR
jgi:hypothetical protein